MLLKLNFRIFNITLQTRGRAVAVFVQKLHTSSGMHKQTSRSRHPGILVQPGRKSLTLPRSVLDRFPLVSVNFHARLCFRKVFCKLNFTVMLIRLYLHIIWVDSIRHNGYPEFCGFFFFLKAAPAYIKKNPKLNAVTFYFPNQF